MTQAQQNPFDITKASHLTDSQIHSYWVDLPGGGHVEIGNPTSRTPMLIRGGKGSGKTHLMRYYSFALQKLRTSASTKVAATVKREGYIGVYFKCSGLNAGRFAGKGCGSDVWRAVFSYYCELWLAEHALGVLHDLVADGSTLSPSLERALVVDIVSCFDRVENEIGNLAELRSFLADERRAIDLAVNNAPLKERLDIQVSLTPGKLVFGLPRIFWRHFPIWEQTLIVYLIDEFENFSAEQQRYINTLIRETEPPCTFKIGGRHYGFKTYKTFSDEEENKEGSEYDSLSLDNTLREKPEYKSFAARLCLRRLAQHGYNVPPTNDVESALEYLRQSFDVPEEPVAFPLGPNEPRYVARLRQQLKEGLESHCAAGITKDSEIDHIVRALAVAGQPLLEKVNLLVLYQRWAKGKPLLQTADTIQGECARYQEDTSTASDYAETFAHYKSDLLAQLRRDLGKQQGQPYLGIDCFIEMSEGLPRNLLIILKHIFKWAVFYGEEPFRGQRVSEKAQTAGVREAAEWFLNDARSPGIEGQAVRTGVSRVARLFNEIRFSDKPAECSLCTFSMDYETCAPDVRKIVDLAEQWSLLIQVAGGQKDRNKLRVDKKYQINGMLSPHWDLPVSRRGALPLSAEQLGLIFAEDAVARSFEEFIRDRVGTMRAPCFGKGRRKSRASHSAGQASLLGE